VLEDEVGHEHGHWASTPGLGGDALIVRTDSSGRGWAPRLL
jgi:hypothetical protein